MATLFNQNYCDWKENLKITWDIFTVGAWINMWLS